MWQIQEADPNIQRFADKIMSFMPLIDMFDEDPNELRARLANMHNNLAHQQAIWPMFDMDALEKVDIRSYELKVFARLIDLIEARMEQREKVPQIQASLGQREKIAKELWL